jgi:hypothetical protein
MILHGFPTMSWSLPASISTNFLRFLGRKLWYHLLTPTQMKEKSQAGVILTASATAVATQAGMSIAEAKNRSDPLGPKSNT